MALGLTTQIKAQDCAGEFFAPIASELNDDYIFNANECSTPCILDVYSTFTINEDFTATDCELNMGLNSTIVVENGATLTLSNCTISSVEGVLWNGIVASGSDAEVTLSDGTSITGANTAVTSINGASLTIIESTLNINETAVSIEDYEGTVDCTITGSNFVAGSPADSPVEYVGINVSQVGSVNIGSNLAASNEFVGMHLGIMSLFSSLNIENCTFNVAANGIGIQALELGGTGDYAISVDNSRFYGVAIGDTYGIKVGSMRMSISNNIINNFQKGIFGMDVEHMSFMYRNEIMNCNYAITADNVIANQDRNVGIYDNQLAGNFCGIRATNIQSNPEINTLSLKVDNNTITGPTYETGFQYGVQINNCDNSAISSNIISMDELPFTVSNSNENDQRRAIQIVESQNGLVMENTIQQAGTGIWVGGQCLNTQFTCNVFESYAVGMYFLVNSLDTSSEINNQGTATQPTDNVWLKKLPRLRVLAGPTATSVDWFHRGNSPSSQVFSPVEDAAVANFSFIDYIGNSGNGYSTNCNGDNGIGTDYPIMRERMMGSVVRGEIVRETLIDEFDKKSKDYVYDYLKRRPDMIYLGEDDDIVFQSFYDLVDNSNIAEFRRIFDKMDEKQMMQALQMNAEIIAEDLMDENQKIVNQLYLEKFIYGIQFSTEELETLTNIATLTPYLGGDAVFSARVMLDLWPEETGVSYRTDGSIDEEFNGELAKDNFMIYPNPAINNLTIAFNYVKSIEGLSISIVNIMGQEVLREELNFNGASTNLNIEKLKAGIYHINILRGSESILKDKLVVAD